MANGAIPFGDIVSTPVTTPFVDKVIQDLNPADTANFGHVDYLHYDGSTLVASYDTAVGGNLALFQPIVADYATFGPGTGGPITVSTGNGGTATTNLALVTQADDGGPVDFVYVNDPGRNGGAGQTELASYQNPVSVPEVHGESYTLPLNPNTVVSGNASSGTPTAHTPDVTLVSQEANGTIDLLGYDITETGATPGSSGGGVVTLTTSDEVGSSGAPGTPFAPIGQVVGVADTQSNGTVVVAQDTAGHLEFMHLANANAGVPNAAPHYVVDAFTVTSGTYAPVSDVDPDGVIANGPTPPPPAPPDQLDLVATLKTGDISQIQELYFNLSYTAGTPAALTATTTNNEPSSIVEANALPAGWQPVDGGVIAAQHFGDSFFV